MREEAGGRLRADDFGNGQVAHFFISRRLQLATLATRHLIPAVYNAREYAEAVGLMTYGTSLTEVFRHISAYTIRILKGTNPADLPVVQSTKFDFVINLPTAQALRYSADPTRPRSFWTCLRRSWRPPMCAGRRPEAGGLGGIIAR